MKVIANFTLVPIGTGLSLSQYVAACQRILQQQDVTFQLHANGTNVEGEWENVFDAIKQCHEVVHDMGVKRIFTTMQFGTRTDRQQTMQDKETSVRQKLQNDSSE